MNLECQFCNTKFDLRQNLPRILPVCKHRICDDCLSDHFQSQFNIICQQDNLIYQIVNARLDQFAIDKECIFQIKKYKQKHSKKRKSTQLDLKNDQKTWESNDSDSQNKNDNNKAHSQFNFVNEKQRITKQGKNLVITDISNLYSNKDEFELEDQSQLESQDISRYPQEESIDMRSIHNQSQNQSYSMQNLTEHEYYQQKVDQKFNKKYCKEHKLFKDEVCLQCAQKVCAKCALYGDHKDHHNQVKSYKSFLKEVNEYKDNAKSWIKKIKQKENFLKEDFLEKTLKQKTMTKYKLMKQEIKTIFENVMKKLEVTQQNLLNNLKEKFSSQKRAMKDQVFNFLEDQNLDKKELLSEIKQVLQALKNRSDEHELMVIMRQKDEVNLYNSVRQLVKQYKKTTNKFSQEFENFINKIQLVKNENLDLNFAYLKQPENYTNSENQLSDYTQRKKYDKKKSNAENNSSQIATQVIEDDLLNLDSRILEFPQDSFVITNRLDSFPKDQFLQQRSDVSNKKDNFIKQKQFSSFQRQQSILSLSQRETQHRNIVIPNYEEVSNQSYMPHQQNSLFLRGGEQDVEIRQHSRQLSTSMSLGQMNIQAKTKNKELINRIKKFANSKNQTLNLNNLKIEDQDLQKLSDLLKSQTNLKNLQLRNNKITDKGIECLIREIKHQKIFSLDFSKNLLTTKTLKTIFKNLDNLNIETIIAKDIPIKEEVKKNYIQKFKKKKIELILN